MTQVPEPDPAVLDAFWARAKVRGNLNRLVAYSGPVALDTLQPPAWSFGATAEQANELCQLVLDGVKTATAGALWDYEAAGEEVPKRGDLSIILDGTATPRALITITDVKVVPFDQVSAVHAHAEGEGDRSLAYWRQTHQDFFTRIALHDKGFATDMPVVCETFKVLHHA